MEIAVQKVKNVSSRVATATSPSYNMKEDRGHVGGLFKRCSDHVFYFHGGKGKKAIGRKKIRMENKRDKGIFQIDFVIEGFILIQLDLKSNRRIQNEISDTSRCNKYSSIR